MTKTTWVDDTTYATATELNRIEDQLLVICTSSTRPTGVDGQSIYETDTNRRYHYDGASWIGRTDDAWTSFSPSWTNLTVGNATNNGYYRYVEGHLHVVTSLVLGSTSSVSGLITLTLPNSAALVSAIDNVNRQFGQALFKAGDYSGTVVRGSATTNVYVKAFTASGTYLKITNTSGSIPITFTTSDEIHTDFVVPTSS